MEQRFYTVSDIEKITHKTYCTIWRWTKRGKFPCPLKVNHTLLWDVDDIENWLDECRIIGRTMRFVGN